MKINIIRITFLFVTIFLAGCVSTNKVYDGPERPKSELSIINQLYVQETTSSDIFYHFILRKVDGKPVPDSGGIAGVELIPGRHTFTYEILNISIFPSTIFVNKKHYDLEVTTLRGMKGFTVFKEPDGGKELCMFFSDINGSYPFLKHTERPPNTKYKYECQDVGVETAEDNWMRR